MLNQPREEEMKQFYYINSQAKNVPTDLTFELLQRMARQNHAEEEYLSVRQNKSGVLAGARVWDRCAR